MLCLGRDVNREPGSFYIHYNDPQKNMKSHRNYLIFILYLYVQTANPHEAYLLGMLMWLSYPMKLQHRYRETELESVEGTKNIGKSMADVI